MHEVARGTGLGRVASALALAAIVIAWAPAAEARPAKPVPVLSLGLRVLWNAFLRAMRRLFRNSGGPAA